jgi:hypothetical protein
MMTSTKRFLLSGLRWLALAATVVACLGSSLWSLPWLVPVSLGCVWALLAFLPWIARRLSAEDELMLATDRRVAPGSEARAAPASTPYAVSGELAGQAAPTPSPEPVRFLALHPARIAAEGWSPFWSYAFKPSESSEVFEDADLQGGDHGPLTFSSATAKERIPSGVVLVARPEGEGLRFDPPQQSARWRGRWRRFDFRVAVEAVRPVRLQGRVTFSAEGLLIAEVPFELLIGDPAEHAPSTRSPSVKPYDAIFPSYSHRDKQIVERFERVYRALGLEYLRDVTTLRSGQKWQPELGRLIEQADIFQLFWSSSAATSEYVTKEWQAALRLIQEKRKPETFIRPVYWEEPMPAPPSALGGTHFAYEPSLDR